MSQAGQRDCQVDRDRRLSDATLAAGDGDDLLHRRDTALRHHRIVVLGASLPRHVTILMLAPFASGAEHQTLALCRYLQDRCQVTLLVNDELAALMASDDFLRRYTAPLT